MGDVYSFPARILVCRERLEDARRVLGKVYPYATPGQVELKVTDCAHREGVVHLSSLSGPESPSICRRKYRDCQLYHPLATSQIAHHRPGAPTRTK